MDRPSFAGVSLTKRGFVLALVTSAAILGAGFGYVLPALTGTEEVPEESVETTASTTTEMIDRAAGEETTTESENRTSGIQTTHTTTGPATKTEKTSYATETTSTTTETSDTEGTSGATEDGSRTDSSSERPPSGDTQVEINGTIGTVDD